MVLDVFEKSVKITISLADLERMKDEYFTRGATHGQEQMIDMMILLAVDKPEGPRPTAHRGRLSDHHWKRFQQIIQTLQRATGVRKLEVQGDPKDEGQEK